MSCWWWRARRGCGDSSWRRSARWARQRGSIAPSAFPSPLSASAPTGACRSSTSTTRSTCSSIRCLATRRSARRSAGILLHRRSGGELEVLLVHPGGPAWARRDLGAWSIPKGEYEPEEEPLAAARREFAEELGKPPPDGEVVDLGEVRQKSGKLVRAWSIEGDFDESSIISNTFPFQWPPR